MRLLEEILLGWVVGFILPKSIVIPIFRGMYRSMRETERLDELERAALGYGGDDDGGVPVRRFRPRRRPPRRPDGGMPQLRAGRRKPRNPV